MKKVCRKETMNNQFLYTKWCRYQQGSMLLFCILLVLSLSLKLKWIWITCDNCVEHDKDSTTSNQACPYYIATKLKHYHFYKKEMHYCIFSYILEWKILLFLQHIFKHVYFLLFLKGEIIKRSSLISYLKFIVLYFLNIL